MTQEQEQVHSQASEEAMLDEAMSDVCDDICAHQSTPGDCAAPHRVCRNCMADLLRKFVDRVSRERTRQALERAAKRIEDYGHSNGRIRATHKALAAAVRALEDAEGPQSEAIGPIR